MKNKDSEYAYPEGVPGRGKAYKDESGQWVYWTQIGPESAASLMKRGMQEINWHRLEDELSKDDRKKVDEEVLRAYGLRGRDEELTLTRDSDVTLEKYLQILEKTVTPDEFKRVVDAAKDTPCLEVKKFDGQHYAKWAAKEYMIPKEEKSGYLSKLTESGQRDLKDRSGSGDPPPH